MSTQPSYQSDVSPCVVLVTYREEVGGLPEPHLPGLDHVDGVLEGLLLRHLGAVDADALELEAGLQGGVCGKQKKVGFEQ